ncbi:hypothetical protein DACRYDRAFT_112167 [Dacryopinax primogenitus]|uniref:Uncharacterized protein n=1 Tax=Dacryopinax primogenitus (strain DJM 731) TaxID=1858805 RepID=M5G0A7_DACPD|nr:uncharacterized protein DACRYDRAFT_112167 [Dacryopinax primogenitus]EJT97217.1 hypothetical protein DACRYDRAFT_112167 [Dacryopinax primogenitus]
MHARLALLVLSATVIFAHPIPAPSDIAHFDEGHVLDGALREELDDGRALVARGGDGKPSVWGSLGKKLRIANFWSEGPKTSYHQLPDSDSDTATQEKHEAEGERLKQEHQHALETHRMLRTKVVQATQKADVANKTNKRERTEQTRQAHEEAQQHLKTRKDAVQRNVGVVRKTNEAANRWEKKNAERNLEKASHTKKTGKDTLQALQDSLSTADGETRKRILKQIKEQKRVNAVNRNGKVVALRAYQVIGIPDAVAGLFG